MRRVQEAADKTAAAEAKLQESMRRAAGIDMSAVSRARARAMGEIAAANDNATRSWRSLNAMIAAGNQGVRGSDSTNIHDRNLREFEGRLKALGLQDAVVTGMLKKTEDGFVQLANPAHDAAGAIADVSKSLTVVTESADPATKATGDFAKSLTLMTAAGAVVGVIAAVRKAMDDMSATVDRGQDTRLGTEAIMALEVAATRARVPVTELSSAIDKFTAVSKQAPEDAETFHRALSNINPALSEAFQSAPTQTERLRILSEGFSQAKGEVQKYQLATEALGSDSDRLVRLFSSGRAALDEHIASARRWGIVVDEAFIKQSQEAEAQLNTLALLIRQRLTVAVVDGTSAVVEFGRSFGNLNSFVPSALSTLEGFRSAIRDVAYDMSLLAKAWNELMAPGPVTRESLGRMVEPLGLMFGVGDPGVLKRKMAVEGHDAGKSFADAFYDAIRGAAAGANVPVPLSDPRKAGLGAFQPRPSLKDDATTLDEFDRLERSLQRAAAAQEAEAMAVGKSVGEHAKLRAELRLLEAAQQAGIEITDEYAARIEKVSDRLGKAAQLSAERAAGKRVRFDEPEQQTEKKAA